MKTYYSLNKNIILKNQKEYYKKYPWLKTLSEINRRCNNSKCKDYKSYGGRGIKNFLTQAEIKELWFRDKAYKMKKPSIDRIDNDGNYKLNNCRFIELINNCSRNKRKSVCQFTLEGKFIRKYSSITEAGHIKDIDISDIAKCCKAFKNSAGGFKWRYNDGKM